MWWLIAGVVWAAEAVPQAAEGGEQPSEVVDVVGGSAGLRAKLDGALRSRGYRSPRRRSDRTVYIHRSTYKPRVILYDDGRLEMARAPIRFGPPGEGPWGSGGQRLCVGIPTAPSETEVQTGPVAVTVVTNVMDLGCAHLDGPLFDRRKLASATRDVLEDVGGLAAAWSRAVAEEAFDERLDLRLPGELQDLWFEAGGGEAGTEALIAYGCSRTESAEGDAVRSRVHGFLVGLDAPGIQQLDGGWRPVCSSR
jgi:hypothetical protein